MGPLGANIPSLELGQEFTHLLLHLVNTNPAALGNTKALHVIGRGFGVQDHISNTCPCHTHRTEHIPGV